MRFTTQETNHTKAFITAIGIAFAFLAFVVLYVAFSKGGLDIRSRASGICKQRTTLTGNSRILCDRVECVSYLSASSCNSTCCSWNNSAPISTPIRSNTPTPTKKTSASSCEKIPGQWCSEYKGTCASDRACAGSGNCSGGVACCKACPTQKYTPIPTIASGRCCPKVNTTYAKNTCYGASKTGCTKNSTYCEWNTNNYCRY